MVDGTSTSTVSSHPHRFRLCLLHRWKTDSGFGFTMHSEKAKSGQLIGKVEPNSPAQLGGLREGDRLVEVDRVNVETSTHDEVAAKIKSSTGPHVALLVVDADADEYFKDKHLSPTEILAFVEKITCPDERPQGKIYESGRGRRRCLSRFGRDRQQKRLSVRWVNGTTLHGIALLSSELQKAASGNIVTSNFRVFWLNQAGSLIEPSCLHRQT